MSHGKEVSLVVRGKWSYVPCEKCSIDCQGKRVLYIMGEWYYWLSGGNCIVYHGEMVLLVVRGKGIVYHGEMVLLVV